MSRTFVAVAPSDLVASAAQQPDGSRLFRLPHPRTGQPALFAAYAQAKGRYEGVLEISTVNPQRGRSWFIGDDQVVSDGSLLLYTPIDAFFLAVPLLLVHLSQVPPAAVASSSKITPSSTSFFADQLAAEKASSSRSRFLPLDDLILEVAASSEYRLPKPFPRKRNRDEPEPLEESIGEEARDWNEDVVRLCELDGVKEALMAICEVQNFKQNPEDTDAEAPERRFYRPSATRVLESIRGKVDAVSRALLQPCSDGETASTPFPTLVRQLARDGIDLDHLRKSKGDERVARQAAERIAIQVVGQWLPAVVMQSVVESYDSSALDDYLEAQAAASFAMSAASALPTPPASDAGAAVPGKKGAAAKKGGNSRGVDTLKKVNTQKMPKLTSFFKKK